MDLWKNGMEVISLPAIYSIAKQIAKEHTLVKMVNETEAKINGRN